ncbi:MAG: hypothetical protein JRF43_03835 [Deltaproteobacteria bacterium]|nr:hypothetical protein [Deltaproteobacteria bacterium]MCD6197416.1 hypothetical protein [Deltaproteobacteria bacterium]
MGQVAHETETVICAWAIKGLPMGSRRGCISQVRLQIAYQLVQDYGIPLAEVARHLGISTSAISKAITRRTKEYVKPVTYV